MDEQMIEQIARAISVPEHHTTWDILTDREKDLYLMQARAAYSVMAGKVAELIEALKVAQTELVARGCWNNAVMDAIDAALAPYPERRSEHHE